MFYFGGTLGLCCCAQAFSTYGELGATLSLWSVGFSLWWLLSLLKPQALGSWVSVAEGVRALQSWLVSSRTRARSVAVKHQLSCSVACGIFPDQGSNLCLLPWQVDSYPLHHQQVQYLGFLTFVAAHKIFSYSMQFLSCSMWDLVL